MWQWGQSLGGFSALFLQRVLLYEEALQNQVGSLLPLASCHLRLNHAPFHYVASTNMLSTYIKADCLMTHVRTGVALA